VASRHLRDAWLEIDTSAITSNVRALKALTKPNTLFMAVVKADGYGHGAAQSTAAALAGGADRVGVATVPEGLALRAAGVTAPIQVLSEPPTSAMDEVVAQALTPTVFLPGTAAALSAAARRAGKRAPYHLKVDTGMNRIGVSAEQAAELVLSFADLEGIRLEGVFTHFATADVPGDWDFDRQMERFAFALEEMVDNGIRTGIVHAANSPATVLHPESHFDMVRCGIAIYGLHPAPSTRDRVGLTPAMSVKARVSNVHRVGTGDGVSYGHVWRAPTPTDIATVPLGYADGLHRITSGRIRVLCRGASCPQVGRICMDQFMFEVPRGAHVSVGDEVVIVGEQSSERISLEELAGHAGSINYEMACSLSRRLERIRR
jgi:alanine racemase